MKRWCAFFLLNVFSLVTQTQTKLNQEGCGVLPQYESKRIVGGSSARPWPWMAALVLVDKQWLVTRWGEFCGGSVIDNKWVLTAAHCVINQEDFQDEEIFNLKAELGGIKAVLGQNNIGQAPGYMHYIKRAHVHPSYDLRTSDYDIALLELVEPVTYDDKLKPVCLDLDGNFECSGASCPRCMAMGWGSTDGIDDPASASLQELERRMTSNVICKLVYRTVTDRMQCYGAEAGPGGVCSGDSGGPIICDKKSLWYQSAVISRGLIDRKGECGTKLSYGLHTRLSSPQIRDWLLNTIGED